LQVARQIGDREHEVWLLGMPLPLIAFHRGDLSLAEQYLQLSRDIASRIGHLEVQALANNMLALIAHWRGEYEAALRYGSEAVEIALPLEDFTPYILAPALGTLGMIYQDISQQFTPKIIELHQHALHLLEAPMGAMTGGLPWADLGLCAISVGDYHLAQDVLEKGLNTPNLYSRIERPRHLAGAALLACSQGDLQKALNLADEGRAYAEERQLRQHYPLTALTQGKVRAAAGQHEQALPVFEQAIREAQAMQMRPILWQANAAAAQALLVTGRRQDAWQAWAAAKEVVGEIGNLFQDVELRQAYLASVQASIIRSSGIGAPG
jgi:tetratricopeptide (TPR) repeat protein